MNGASAQPANAQRKGARRSANDAYLAVFFGNQMSQRWKAWNAMSDDERRAKEQEGLAAWKAWVEKRQDAIVNEGGPLGKTKRTSRDGAADANELAVFMVVRASSHEAAAKTFEVHPHFTIFPGEAVEVMPLLPIPGA